MSGYFDALMRSSGITVGLAEPASARLAPEAIEVDDNRSTIDTDATALHLPVTPHEAAAPLHSADNSAEAPVPQAPRRVERHTLEEPATPPVAAHPATESAAHSPQQTSAPLVEPPIPDLGHALVRAAVRWVAAGPPHVSADSAVGNLAQGVPGQQSMSPAPEQVNTVATKRRDDDGRLESPNRALATHEPLNVPPAEAVAEKPVPIRASLVAPAPVPPVAPSVRNEVVHVSIGAIHVRVDAPQAQTVARPAPPPAVSTRGDATIRPARSALSRRALRRI